jgi:hypothetical protein
MCSGVLCMAVSSRGGCVVGRLIMHGIACRVQPHGWVLLLVVLVIQWLHGWGGGANRWQQKQQQQQ